MRTLPILLNLLLIANCLAGQLKPPRGMQISRGHPQSRGLVFFPLFNEGSGNKVFDLSGNNNTGTFQGTAPSWTAGKFGSAVLLPGNNEYINIPDSDFVRSPRTISIWIKQNAYVESAYIFYWPTVLALNNTQQILLYVRNNHWKFIHDTRGTGGTSGATESSVDISSDLTWHHLVCIVRPTVLEIWDNGQKVATTGGLTNTYRTDTLDVKISQGANSFNGLIDIPMIYNRALSAGEIALLYREPFCMFQQDVPLMAVEAPAPPGAGQVIMITSLPVLFVGLYLCRKYKAEVL